MDARKGKRFPVRCPVSFLGEKGTLLNLSINGGAVESDRPVQPGATMTLKLHLPSLKQPLNIDRVGVTWTAGQDFGIEFLSLAPQERERLQQLIADLQQGTPKKNDPA